LKTFGNWKILNPAGKEMALDAQLQNLQNILGTKTASK
jgi:hypothetical protein